MKSSRGAYIGEDAVEPIQNAVVDWGHCRWGVEVGEQTSGAGPDMDLGPRGLPTLRTPANTAQVTMHNCCKVIQSVYFLGYQLPAHKPMLQLRPNEGPVLNAKQEKHAQSINTQGIEISAGSTRSC